MFLEYLMFRYVLQSPKEFQPGNQGWTIRTGLLLLLKLLDVLEGTHLYTSLVSMDPQYFMNPAAIRLGFEGSWNLTFEY